MKKLLFLFMTMLLSIFLVACDEGTTDTSSSSDESGSTEETEDSAAENADEEDSSDEAEENGNLTVGDTAELDGAKFTLKSVTTTDERNEFEESDPTAVIKIEYELENLSDEEIPYGAEITVYDAEGNQMEPYPLDNSMGSLAPGKKVQGVEHHGVEAVGTIEIHFAPLFSFEEAVFEVEIE